MNCIYIALRCSLLKDFNQLKDQMKAAMSEVYYEDCIEEWIEVNLESRMKKLQEVIDIGESQLKFGAKPKDSVSDQRDQDNGAGITVAAGT